LKLRISVDSLIYIRLIGYTAGTLLQLFWMVVILGYRRQRNFERVFFFLCLALFFFYSGSLLALNAQIYYPQPPALLQAFAITLLCAGLSFLPPLLVHLHLEFAETREMLKSRRWKRAVLLAAYGPVLFFALRVYPQLASSAGFDFLIPGNALGRGYGIWLALAMALAAAWEARFAFEALDRAQKRFHAFLGVLFFGGAGLVVYLHVLVGPLSPQLSAGISIALAWLAIPPLAVLIYLVGRFNFLQIGRQKNLVYAVSATFLALLYLSLVRRMSVWLEPALPPEATASILLFVLVIFFEPLQRVLGRRLRETAQTEIDQAHRIASLIQEVARQGDFARLQSFIEQTVKLKLELAEVELILPASRDSVHMESRGLLDSNIAFPLQQSGSIIGILKVKPHGAMLSGETRAALEFLCEQVPGALDLCRLIEEKLRLERELAERERLALVGQMAASISHNLKNPLGSIKTILQVQMENPELPDSLRSETKMVLDEIARLSSKLNQLLQFSRPAVLGGTPAAVCDIREIIANVLNVLRPEAERKRVRLGSRMTEGDSRVEASAEALHDVISNLVVNAIEASPPGGEVKVHLSWLGLPCVVSVEDEGNGIPTELQENVLRPFFTTKPQGTGLGLAIVAKRIMELDGELKIVSPVNGGRGTRFEVKLWPAAVRRGKTLAARKSGDSERP
jgi:signal transduction histidine kinase